MSSSSKPSNDKTTTEAARGMRLASTHPIWHPYEHDKTPTDCTRLLTRVRRSTQPPIPKPRFSINLPLVTVQRRHHQLRLMSHGTPGIPRRTRKFVEAWKAQHQRQS